MITPALEELLDLRASRKGYRAAMLAECTPCSCCCCSCCCIHEL